MIVVFTFLWCLVHGTVFKGDFWAVIFIAMAVDAYFVISIEVIYTHLVSTYTNGKLQILQSLREIKKTDNKGN